MAEYKHILLATDLSQISEPPAQQAMQFAKLYQAKLSIVHVIEPIAAYGYPELADLQSPLIESAKQKLQALADRLSVPQEQCFLEFGPVKKVVPEIAKEQGVDLIVLGSHGRHGIARLLGSSANAIIHHTDCDTVIVRKHD